MRGVGVLLVALLLVGFLASPIGTSDIRQALSTPSEPSPSAPADPPATSSESPAPAVADPATSTSEGLVPPPLPPAPVSLETLQSSPLTVTLRTIEGKVVQLYLYAADEKIQRIDSPSCSSNPGDELRTARYTFYLLPEGATEPIYQAPKPLARDFTFNSNRRYYLTVLPGEVGKYPDLLALTQYGVCNWDEIRIVGLSPDGTELLPYTFEYEDGDRSWTTASKGVGVPEPGLLSTSVYRNDLGYSIGRKWAVHPDEAKLVVVEKTRH